jgi:hypothetical protein
MKTKKQPVKRRKKTVPGYAFAPRKNVASFVDSNNQIIWYPTLPPHDTSWFSRAKEALRGIFL